MGVVSLLAQVLSILTELVLPAECAGCGERTGQSGVCPACAIVLGTAPAVTRPRGAPAALPTCVSVGAYEGVLRALLLAYKERGQRRLAAPLGDALAGAVAAGLPGVARASPLVLVPVPGTAAAGRERHGDHMLRLARRAARRLSLDGWPVRVCQPLRALPKADSTHLDRVARAEAARSAFVLRRAADDRLRAAGAGTGSDAIVVALDDVLTTGATLAAVCGRLAHAGAPVAFAATIAATRLRGVGAIARIGSGRSWDGGDWAPWTG